MELTVTVGDRCHGLDYRVGIRDRVEENLLRGPQILTGQVEGFGWAPLFMFDPADAADLEVTLYFTATASLAIVGDASIEGIEAGVATIELN